MEGTMPDNWVVGIEQLKPYEFVQLEVFEEEQDALHYADTYMKGKAGHQITKRTWVLETGDASRPRLIVRKR